MSKSKANTNFNVPVNKKRGDAKKARGNGRLVMEEKGFDDIQWAKKFDPLYKIGGIERHLKLKEGRV